MTLCLALVLATCSNGDGSNEDGTTEGGSGSPGATAETSDGTETGAATGTSGDGGGSGTTDGPGTPSGGDSSTETGSDSPEGCKRGVAYNRESADDAPAFEGIGWWYNWAPTPEPDAYAALRAAGVEYVPMVWSGPPTRDIDVDRLIDEIPEDARFLLGFNEPNFGAQASLTPAQAAAAWPLLEQVADARDLELVSPALNYCGGDCNETDPFVWLDEFFAACEGCRVDYVAFHWYACTPEALEFALEGYEAYGLPVWLTEFSCLDQADISMPVQDAYMREAVPILEADPQVFRYAWFIGRSYPEVESYNLFDAPGERTALGDTYVSLDGACSGQ